MLIPPTASPRWSSTTKLLVGLVIIGIVTFLLYRFTSLVPPLLMVFILVYLLHPVITGLSRSLQISWRASVNILFLVMIVILVGLLAWGGVALVQQVQSLIIQIQTFIVDLPTYLANLFGQVYQIGPFEFDMRTVDFNAISRQLLSLIQPLLGRTGDLVAMVAGGAVEVLGWTLFILAVAYFVMVESSGLREDLLKVEIPGYTEDLRRLGNELSRIWNAFLRGQIIIFVLALAVYSVLLPALGVRYALGLALMAGLAKFLPYIGPAITWVVMALVTFLQPFKPFGLSPLLYTVIVVIVTLTVDQVIDTLITPRIMARTLKVHPAAVLVAALIAANLLGLLGVVIAAPFLATILLLGRYVMRKMFDLDPWPPVEMELRPSGSAEWFARLRQLRRALPAFGGKRVKPDKENSNEQQS
ncbi:MAG TPA: AI-2E family transporter [Anaerolineales bacterium]|nr:AI-2E family transporter [Anaerolineales bacterium]